MVRIPASATMAIRNTSRVASAWRRCSRRSVMSTRGPRMMASRAATTIQVRTRRTSQPSSRTAAAGTIAMVAAMVRIGIRDRVSCRVVPPSLASLASAVGWSPPDVAGRRGRGGGGPRRRGAEQAGLGGSPWCWQNARRRSPTRMVTRAAASLGTNVITFDQALESPSQADGKNELLVASNGVRPCGRRTARSRGRLL